MLSPQKRRSYDNHKKQRSKEFTYNYLRQTLKKKYGLSVLNATLLFALFFSWIWIFSITFNESSSVSTISHHSPIIKSNHRPSHMKELVDTYNKLKWMDEHSKKNKSHSFKSYNHSINNKMFQIWSDDEQKEKEICPPQFPLKPPKFEQMKYVCSHLDWFKFGGFCDDSNCSDCIPPNSKVSGKEWINSDTAPWLKQYEITMDERRENLTQILHKNALFDSNDGPIIVMTINKGYLFLFLNYVCSLNWNKIKLIKERTLIITTSKESIPLLQKSGFSMILYPEWLGEKLLSRIDPSMPQTFALGAHRWIVALQISVVSDLVQIGYDVIVQDSDIIYVNNPLSYLLQPRFKYFDIMMMTDERMDRRGPGNSGFYFVKSNCKTKIFMQTMINLIGAVLSSRSDQILWNTLINEKQFRMIQFETLSSDYFVGGNQINLKYGTKQKDLPNDVLLIHACWTTTQFDKVEKFWNVGHYYFTKERCPDLYDEELRPDLKNQKWHIREKTREQQAKLLEYGVVRDTSNGFWTTPEQK